MGEELETLKLSTGKPKTADGGESVTDVVERLLGSLPMGNGHVRDVPPAKPPSVDGGTLLPSGGGPPRV